MFAKNVEMKTVSETIQLKIKGRQIANLEILKILSRIVEQHPELRFCQILSILGLDRDRFYEESIDTLESIKKSGKI